MGVWKLLPDFIEGSIVASDADGLSELLREVTARMGFDYYALTHHVDLEGSPGTTIRLHNYPAQWVEYFDLHGLAATDPIHRASQRSAAGFVWRHVPRMIPLTRRDLQILSLAKALGIGDGVTIPANVPGEITGSCSFAFASGTALSPHSFAAAQVVGTFAFESARRLWQVRGPSQGGPARLTDRQRDCLIWAARGKGDWEAGQILGISEETVAQHIRQACERYGVQKRTSLMIHALFDGTITFADIAQRWYPSFPG